jgi:hypothetical protein
VAGRRRPTLRRRYRGRGRLGWRLKGRRPLPPRRTLAAAALAAIAAIAAAAALGGPGRAGGLRLLPLRVPTSAFVAPPGDRAAPLTSPVGVDVSWPQCPGVQLPGAAGGFLIVGVTGGRPFTPNRCAGHEAASGGRRALAGYANLSAPRAGDPDRYGTLAGRDAARRAIALRLPFVWLDIEPANTWSTHPRNARVIAAALRALRAAGLGAGVYSAPRLWARIAGRARIHAPVWLATPFASARAAALWCALPLAGTRPSLVQFLVTARGRGNAIDGDLACPGARLRRLFRLPGVSGSGP